MNKPLNEINIDGYKYKYKATYKKGICYRYFHLYSCKVNIVFSIEEYNKISNNTNNSEIKYEVNSKQ